MNKREIKFRGISKETGLFVYGFYVQGMYDGTSKTVEHGICRKGCYPVEVIEDTVSQFTGMKDKHGADIYEGDILRDSSYDKSRYDTYEYCYGEVVFADCTFKQKYTHKDGAEYFDEISRYEEVIGNIYQNPMLLEDV